MSQAKEILKTILTNLFKSIVPIEKAIAFFKRPECMTTEMMLLDLESKIKENDVLFSRIDWELSNLAIRGQYTHIAVYRNGLVYEAVTSGVRTISLREWFFKKDHVGLARCNMFVPNEDQLAVGLEFLNSCLGEPYDYDFAEFTRSSQFCSAYWYEYMQTMFGDRFSVWFPKHLFFGVLPYLTPIRCWSYLDKMAQYN